MSELWNKLQQFEEKQVHQYFKDEPAKKKKPGAPRLGYFFLVLVILIILGLNAGIFYLLHSYSLEIAALNSKLEGVGNLLKKNEAINKILVSNTRELEGSLQQLEDRQLETDLKINQLDEANSRLPDLYGRIFNLEQTSQAQAKEIEKLNKAKNKLSKKVILLEIEKERADEWWLE